MTREAGQTGRPGGRDGRVASGKTVHRRRRFHATTRTHPCSGRASRILALVASLLPSGASPLSSGQALPRSRPQVASLLPSVASMLSSGQSLPCSRPDRRFHAPVRKSHPCFRPPPCGRDPVASLLPTASCSKTFSLPPPGPIIHVLLLMRAATTPKLLFTVASEGFGRSLSAPSPLRSQVGLPPVLRHPDML
jgi:hypothetical protein